MPNFEEVPRPLTNVDTMRSARPAHPSTGKDQRKRRAAARKQASGVFAILVLACLGLSACGGSSGSSSNAAATAASTTGSATGGSTGATSTGGSSTQGSAAGAGRRRFGAIRECLQKNGVTLPQRTPGSGAPGGGFPGAGGGPALPKGVTRTQFEAAMKKCGGGNFGARSGRNGGAGFRRVNNPVFKAALTKYAACLRQNGIDIPAPNTSGKGPIFSTKGIDTSSAKFRAATLKCRAGLTGAFRRPQGANGAPGAPAPPASGTTKSAEASR
ncbi:MAG: hypothetical protein WBV85_13025 [Solirubrobacteraceae bacterium]